jgi:TonB family protein
VSTGRHIPLAVCVSLALHGAAFATIERIPRGSPLGKAAPATFDHGMLQARLKAAPVSEPRVKQPSAHGAGPVPDAVAARSAAGAVARPVYLPASELDEKPLIRTPVHPEFPAFSPVPEGRVVLRLFIAESGRIDAVAVVNAEPAQVFEEAAVRAFSNALFTPGRKNGEPVKSTLMMELLFGAPLPLAEARAPQLPLWQPPRRARPTPPPRKETP